MLLFLTTVSVYGKCRAAKWYFLFTMDLYMHKFTLAMHVFEIDQNHINQSPNSYGEKGKQVPRNVAQKVLKLFHGALILFFK